MSQFNAYIVEAVRTAGGKKGGRLSTFHPADLGAIVVDELVERTKIDPSEIEDVIVGCVSQVGHQTGNLGRCVVLASRKLPLSVPGTTVDRQCGSGQQALHFAAQAVMSGTQDVVVAAGVEMMSVCAMGSSFQGGNPFSAKGIQEKYPGVFFSQFEGAEILAKKHNITKEQMDDFAAVSNERGYEATKKGYFKREIVPIKTVDPKTKQEVIHDTDEGIKYPVDREKMAKLPLLKKDGGRITAASASQICDGAAAILVCNERGLKKLGLKPRARFVALALAGSDPVEMLGAPIPATQSVLKKANMTMNDIDLYEVNEAFASVPLSWLKVLGGDFNKLNVNGGAMALGHPLGATGVKLMTTLVNELERRKAKYGVLAICEGGGTANATIIENVSGQSKL